MTPAQKSALWFTIGIFSGMGIATAVTVAAINNSAKAEGIGQETLLYDLRANECVANHGVPMNEVFYGNRATPYIGYPRWIVPGKVTPVIAGDPTAVTYSYYDPKTNKYDGPYVPIAPKPR